jgi:hypothetical protein
MRNTNEQLEMNSEQWKPNYLGVHLALFIVICSLFIACHNPFDLQKQETPAEGKGYFSLSIDGTSMGRTILPNTVQSDFAIYILEFYFEDTDTLAITPPVERNYGNLSESVSLGLGRYDVYVSAYMDEGKNKLAALGELKNIEIKDGDTTARTVTLEPLADGEGEGIFRWEIGYPITVSEASMTITRLPITPETAQAARTMSFTGAGAVSKTGSATLKTGYYRVVFKLKNAEGFISERWETLHIYQNMESVFNGTLRFIIEQDVEDFGPGALISDIFNVYNTGEWNRAISAITNGGNNQNYVINVMDNFAVASNPDATFGSVSGITVSLRGAGKTLSLSSGNGNMIRIASVQSVILRDLTLRGNISNNGSVVYATGTNSVFTMNSGKITGAHTSDRGGGVYVLSGGSFTMNEGEISGNTADSYGGGVYVGSSGTFTMNGGKISGANTSDRGGGVYMGSAGTFIMNGGEISGNIADGSNSYGGGVYVNGNAFTMNGGKISGNTAFTNGGGICVSSSGSFIMRQGEISSNTASSSVGGVYVSGGIFTMENGKISGNTAKSASNNGGGGVYMINSGAFTMNGGEISSNTASYSGGGVRMSAGAFTMNGGKISGSAALVTGGGVIVVAGTTFTMNDGEISGNKVTRDDSYAGGVYVHDSTFTMISGQIFGNTSAYFGGAMHLTSNSTFTMQNGKISGNTAGYGGGLTVVSSSTFTLNNGEISGNTASIPSKSLGSGVYVNNATFTMISGKIINNACAYLGGGVYITTGTNFTMRGGEISGNTAPYGGGVYAYAGIYTMYGGVISGNTATDSGGGVLVRGGTGTFYFVAGTIYGSNEAVDVRNTAANGVSAALSNGNTAQCGALSGSTWNRSGDLVTTNDTIRVLNVTNATTWNNAVSAISSGGNNKNYIINATASFSIAGHATNTFGNVTGLTVTLHGADRTLTISGTGNILRIGNNQTVILQELTLRGNASNDSSVVYIVSGGTFTMNAGRVSGNTSANNGGGVHVAGTFNMNGGEIAGNTAALGGGVYVVASGAFRIVTGTIYGSSVGSASNRNNATTGGAALHLVSGGTAQRGTFNGTTWTSKASLSTTNNTITVVEGN